MQNIEKHISIVGRLHIALNLISIGLAIFFALYFDALFLPLAIILFSIPGIVAGFGLLKRKSWSRVLGIAMAIFNLLTIPHGTIIGIYSLIVLFNPMAMGPFKRETAIALPQ